MRKRSSNESTKVEILAHGFTEDPTGELLAILDPNLPVVVEVNPRPKRADGFAIAYLKDTDV